MADFSKQITFQNGWTNLLSAMQAAGYTGGAMMNFISVTESGGLNVRVKLGHSSAFSAPIGTTDGIPVTSRSDIFYNVDAGMCWVYANGANPLSVSASSPIDF